MSRLVLVTIGAWSLFFVLVFGLLACVWWKNQRHSRAMPEKPAQPGEMVRELKTASESGTKDENRTDDIATKP